MGTIPENVQLPDATGCVSSFFWDCSCVTSSAGGNGDDRSSFGGTIRPADTSILVSFSVPDAWSVPVTGHTSEEVREILATLETLYQELFPQLNLRQWSGIIYTWLTHSLLDPTNSGRVSMDNLMKLVTTALEWTYEAGKTDVRQETLEQAAELLMLRRDTFRIIDDQDGATESPAQTEPSEAKKESQTLSPKPEHVSEREGVESQNQSATQSKCAFCGAVPIDLQQFLDSGVSLVECPDCTSTSSLTPHKEILQFKPHKRRKTRSTSTEPRWARREMIWTVVNR